MSAAKMANTKLQNPVARLICLIASALVCTVALAAGGGEVVHLSGTLSVQRADGAIMVLGQKSEVHLGDLLTTQKDSYAQINFLDGSTVTMRPYTQLKIDAFNYVSEKPDADNAFFRLIKGGMRTVTGLVGKRGNQNAYRIGTATATIGIRGSIGDTMVCEPTCEGVALGGDKLPSGTHHQTHSGVYTMQLDDVAALDEPARSERVFLAQVAQLGGNVMTDEPPGGGRILLAQASPRIIVIEEGHTGYSNGRSLTVTVGGIGGGLVNLNIPIGGTGLKGAACK